MEKRVAEKYAKLHEACNRYPEIVLSTVEERGGYLNHGKAAKVYVEPVRRAENGFIEKFCL
jgi:hypothetical protein